MSADSLASALVLFAACMGSWHLAARLRVAGRLYARFAAILLASLAVCAVLGLGDAAALFLLPLVGGVLGVTAWARFGARVSDPLVALVLALTLGLGLGGALTGQIALSLLPVVVAALVAGVFALAAGSLLTMLGAVALGLAALAFAGQGADSGTLLLAAAALVGFSRAGGGMVTPEPVSSASTPSGLISPVQQPLAGRVRATIGATISAGRRDTVG